MIGTPYQGTAAVAIQHEPRWRTESLISAEGNRWSRPGEPTIYLAGDLAVALVELGRHLPHGASLVRAWVWTLEVRLDAVVDLRSPEVLTELSLPDHARWVLDEERCRDVAAAVRQRGAQALIVPSAGFIDQQDRTNLVIFAERVPDIDAAISTARPILEVAP